MFRFDQLIRRDMIVRDVKQRSPETVPWFERLRFHPVWDDCDIATAARRNVLAVSDVLDALNDAAFGPKSEKSEHPSN
jgi:hypothetical protein